MKQKGNWKRSLDELVRFVCSVCESKGIDCFLGGETALSAFRDGHLGDFPEVWIPARDARRFMKAALEDKPDYYEVEVALAETGRDSFDVRVCDARTIDFDLNTAGRYRHNCLHVRVRPFVRAGDGKKTASRLKKLRAACRRAELKRAGAAGPRGGFSARAAFRILSALDSKGAASAVVGSKVVPARCLAAGTVLNLEDGAFPVPSECEAYFKALYGEKWSERKVSPYKESEEAFRDAESSWETYSAFVTDLDLGGFSSAKKSYNAFSKEFAKHDREIQRYYRLLAETHKRITSETGADAERPVSIDD